LDTLETTGEPFLIAEGVAAFFIAADGTLVYLDANSTGLRQLVWVNRDGDKTSEIGVLGEEINAAALSPDGRLVAYSAREGTDRGEVWVHEMARGVSTKVGSSEAYDYRPVWSPDGRQVAFSSFRAGNEDAIVAQADGSGIEEALIASPRGEVLSDWNDKHLLYAMMLDQESGFDLWYVERSEDGSVSEPRPFLQGPFDQNLPRFSPDGRYVAYTSNESGRNEVYVDSFPERGRRKTVSNNGGTRVRWSRDGKELFYVEGDDTLMAVKVSTVGEFSPGTATHLFQHPGLTIGYGFAAYDVSVNGRFLMIEPVDSGDTSRSLIRVVQNWHAEFQHQQ